MTLWGCYDIRKLTADAILLFTADANLLREIQSKKMDILMF